MKLQLSHYLKNSTHCQNGGSIALYDFFVVPIYSVQHGINYIMQNDKVCVNQ